jgi:hypothetical protein
LRLLHVRSKSPAPREIVLIATRAQRDFFWATLKNRLFKDESIQLFFKSVLQAHAWRQTLDWGRIGVWPESVILLKNPMNASTTLSMNGKFPMISHAPPFVLRLSKDERKVFQQNQGKDPLSRYPAGSLL